MGNLNNKRRKFKNLRVLSIQVSIVHTSKTFRVPPHLYMVHRSFSTHVRLLGLFQTRIGLFRSLAQIVLAPIAFTEFRISTAPGSFPKSPTQATQTEHRGPPTNQTAHKHVTKVIGTSHAVTRGIYLFTPPLGPMTFGSWSFSVSRSCKSIERAWLQTHTLCLFGRAPSIMPVSL